MNSLFERTHLEPAKHNDNTYEYYNISARTDISKVRDILEKWFYNYPEEEKKELKSRFKKDLGYNIIIHPDLPSSPKKPDFLISKNDLEIYIEAKIVKSKTMEQEAFERKRNELYDNLNKLNTKDFLLNIEHLCFLSQKQPSTRGRITKNSPQHIERRIRKKWH